MSFTNLYHGVQPPFATGGGSTSQFVSVPNEAALIALNNLGFAEGALAYVETWRDFATMRTQALALIPHVILASTPRPAVQWNRLEIPHQSWGTVATYFIDPAGNDENTGQAAGAANALQTVAELARRIQLPTQAMTINVAAGAYGVPLLWMPSGVERTAAALPSITIIGTRTTRVGPFVIDASADVVGNALANFTSAAGAAALIVGDIVESIDGASPLSTAVIIFAPGGGVFVTSRWRNTAGAVVAPPAAVTTLRALTFSSFTRRTLISPCNFTIRDLDIAAIDDRPGGFVIMQTCKLPGFAATTATNNIQAGCSINNTGTHGAINAGAANRNQTCGIFGGGVLSYGFLGRGEFNLGTGVSTCRLEVGVAGPSGTVLLSDAGFLGSASVGIRVEKNGMISIEGTLYGSGHATIGTRVKDGGHVYVLAGVTPTMASTGQELQIDSTAQGPITWASWNAAYGRRVFDATTGSSVQDRVA